MPRWLGMIWTLNAIVGLSTLFYYWRKPEMRLVLIWVLGTGIALGLTVPLAWQRYYLPWILPMCLLAGLGTGTLVQFVWRYTKLRLMRVAQG
jgi:hypothetical protein